MKLKVLIIDDKIPFLNTAIRFLNLNDKVGLIGWTLKANDAIEKINIFVPDLVLLDLTLPDISGFQTIRNIKNLNKEQKIIVLTLHDDPEYRAEAKIAGADGFISKAEFVLKFPDLIDQLFPGK